MDMPPEFEAIVAMSRNRVIGVDNRLPWHLPEDLRYFKNTTMGHPMLMGRKTWDSLGRPLPGRRHIVLSRTMEPRPGVEVVRDPSEVEALDLPFPVFVIGGAEIFQMYLPLCRKVHLTVLEKDVAGDTWLPSFESLFPEPVVLQSFDGYQRLLYEKPPSAS
jgi:dihydrofolate reductase